MTDDLSMMKSQMRTLLNHFDNQEIITEKMIRNACRTQSKEYLPSKLQVILGLIVSGLFVPGFFWFQNIQSQTFSTFFCVFVTLACWYSLFRYYQVKTLQLPHVFDDGSILDINESLLKWKKLNIRHQFVTSILLVVWVGWFCKEQFDSIFNSLDSIIGIIMIFGFVAAFLTTHFVKVNHFTSSMLEDIKELRAE